MAIRSSAVNRRCFDLFTPTATMTSSKSVAARSTMSRCPLVTGSNDPGHTAFFKVFPGSPRKGAAPRAARPSHDFVGWSRGVTVPKRGLAVPLAALGLDPGRPVRLGAARRALDDHHRTGHQPV